jgi:hypothetical protein
MTPERRAKLAELLDFWKRERRAHETGECGCAGQKQCGPRAGDVKMKIRAIVRELNRE